MRSRHAKRHRFTLIEMMVSIVILTIVMAVVVKILHAMQDAWRITNGRAVIFENAQFVLHIIGRDLSGMVTSDLPGQRINYTIDSSEMPDATWKIAFVTMTNLGIGTDTSIRMEVGYALNSDSELIRYTTRITDGPMAYDFHNAPASTWANSWSTDTAVMCTGVESVTFEAWKDFNINNQITDAQDDTTHTPAFIKVIINLSNPKAGSNNIILEDSRTFQKSFFLERGA